MTIPFHFVIWLLLTGTFPLVSLSSSDFSEESELKRLNFKTELWSRVRSNEYELLRSRIGLDRFFEVYNEVPADIYYHECRKEFLNAMQNWKGGLIEDWKSLVRILKDHFRSMGQLEEDSTKMNLFRFLQRFWRNRTDIRDEMAPELLELIQLYGSQSGPGIKVMLISLGCRTIEDYLIKYNQG